MAGTPRRAVGAKARGGAEGCISGDDVACDTMTRENDAKRAWLSS